MKNIITFIVISVLMFMRVDANAETDCPCRPVQDGENPFYVEAFGGANFIQSQKSGGVLIDCDPGYVVSGSLGYRWDYGLRLEFEYAYRRNSIGKVYVFGRRNSIHGYFQSSSYMANLLWDIPLSCWGYDFWKITPFVGGGAGYDHQQVSKDNSTLSLIESNKHFSWQLIMGLAYPIFCNTDISIEYKFHRGGFSLYSHSVGVGLTYKFGL